MRFFKYEGVPTENNRRVLKERTRKIFVKSNSFNQTLQKKAFFCVADADEKRIVVGVICCDVSLLEQQLSAYLDVLELQLADASLEEITFLAARYLLGHAYQNDYIDDDDAVLERFGLSRITNQYGEYGEGILEGITKEAAYAEAERLFTKDTFLPELNRIYARDAKGKFFGHPVHYMILTDDGNVRESMHRLLLQALYENGRLLSKRYVFLDFKPGNASSTLFYHTLYKSCTDGAVIVRYEANDEAEEEDYATGERENIANLCKIVKRYRHRVLTVFCFPRECTKTKNLFYEQLGSTAFVELKEEFVCGERAECFLKTRAKENGVRPDRKLFSKLENDKCYLTPDLRDMFDEWYNLKLKTGIYPQYRGIVTARHEAVKAATKGSAYDELMKMVGLTEAKKVIRLALDYYKAQTLFADKGMKKDVPAMHMVFTGNPGTAKTSVARLFARIMRENNLLTRGHIIEVGRGDLVGKYVGWTAPIIQRKFRQAQGGVLFIDEAYALVDDRNGSFGDEAINTIVQEMENHREDVVVIFAGYPDKMEGFLQKNPGLRSRIAFHVSFADYSADDLCGIAELIARQKGLHLTEDACKKLNGIFQTVREESDFGNGRYVRNIIEKARMAQATRLLSMDFDLISKKDVATICAEDIEMPVIPLEQPVRRIGFCG